MFNLIHIEMCHLVVWDAPFVEVEAMIFGDLQAGMKAYSPGANEKPRQWG